MNSPSSSFSLTHSHLQRHRKEMPDASEDFQKVLDTILSDENNNRYNSYETKQVEDVKDCQLQSFGRKYQTLYSDLNISYDQIHKSETQEILESDSYHSDTYNECGIEQCKKLNRFKLDLNPKKLSRSTSPSIINIFDCHGDLLYSGEDERERVAETTCGDSPPLRFRPINTDIHPDLSPSSEQISDPYTMGANCSSGLYDKQDWHDIMGKDGQSDKKVRRRNKPLKKKHLNLSSKEDCCVVTSQLCTCKHRISDSSPDPVSDPIPIPSPDGLSPTKISSDLSSLDKGDGASPVSGSPNSLTKPTSTSRSVSPTQGRLSKLFGIKILSSSSPKPEVSPNRLLVRRSYSPKTRANSMEEMIRQNNDSVYRQRSYSWSNGKLNAKPAIKVTSTPLIQSPILSPVANHTAIVPTRYISPNSSPRPAGDKSRDKTQSNNSSLNHCVSNSNPTHEQTCPLFKLSKQKDKDGSPEEDEDSDSITPIARRRAVSESQTLRSRQKARRAAANAANSSSQDGDHLRVHWADEGGNSSLSTSVFLSSIRPRSYSHGAVSNMPQRPILKKVVIS